MPIVSKYFDENSNAASHQQGRQRRKSGAYRIDGEGNPERDSLPRLPPAEPINKGIRKGAAIQFKAAHKCGQRSGDGNEQRGPPLDHMVQAGEQRRD